MILGVTRIDHVQRSKSEWWVLGENENEVKWKNIARNDDVLKPAGATEREREREKEKGIQRPRNLESLDTQTHTQFLAPFELVFE